MTSSIGGLEQFLRQRERGQLDGVGLGAHSGHAIPTWEDISWMVEQTTLPIVVKGVMTEEDALLAARAGCAGVT